MTFIPLAYKCCKFSPQNDMDKLNLNVDSSTINFNYGRLKIETIFRLCTKSLSLSHSINSRKIERRPKKKKVIKFYFKQTPIWVSKVERDYLPVRLGALILANTETKFDQKHSKFNKAYQATYKFIEYIYKNRLMNN